MPVKIRRAAAVNEPVIPGDVRDLGLARAGRARIEWAERNMPVLRAIRARFTRSSSRVRWYSLIFPPSWRFSVDSRSASPRS